MMQRVLSIVILCLSFLVFGAYVNAAAPATTEVPILTRINKIEIGVETCQMRVFGETSDGKEELVVLSAGTAAKRWSKEIPYNNEGEIGHVTFNPPWKPTADMQKDQKKKRRKPLKAELPGSKNNPLGWLKFYFYYNGRNSNYGAHTTDKPSSVGRRVSHGCNRMSNDDASWMARIILSQNGHDPDEIFEWVQAHPKKARRILLTDRPKIVYTKK